MGPSQLVIKVNALKRLTKEKASYEREIEEQQKVINYSKSNNSDQYEKKKHEEVLEESKKMIPEIQKKLDHYKNDLDIFLKTYDGEEDIEEACALIKSTD